MNDNIKFSIIIPVYKVEKYLKQCVDSVLNQTYKNMEVILVDDGSPDNCPKICDEYAKCDDRIKVVHKDNGGLSSARNKGLEVVTGDYVSFIDSDDYWDDVDFLSELVQKHLCKKTDVVIFGYYKFFADGKKSDAILNVDRFVFDKEKSEQIKSLVENNIFESQAWTKVVKSELFNEFDLKFNEGIFSEDIDWSARLLICAESFDVCNKTVYAYRQNEASITHTISKKNIVDLKNNIKYIVKLSESINDKKYYEYYMNYCAYQYITFLNCVCTLEDKEDIKAEKEEMKEYCFLLDYHMNSKVKKVYSIKKIFGFNNMMTLLKTFLKMRS